MRKQALNPHDHILFADFETFFDGDYTLKKLNTSSYVRDPRFKAHMLGVQLDDGTPDVIEGKDIAKYLKKIKWHKTATCFHNSPFDSLILQHHYGVVPAYYYDTLAMARILHGADIRNDLDTVARYYGVGNKLEDVLMQSKGVQDLRAVPGLYDKMAVYCGVDVNVMYKVFCKMMAGSKETGLGGLPFPLDELDLIHITTRMFADPVLRMNDKLLREARDEEVERKRNLFFKALSPEQQAEAKAEMLKDKKAIKDGKNPDNIFDLAKWLLGKDRYFVPMMQALGVEPPQKFSDKQNKMIYATAKGDLEPLLEDLGQYEDEQATDAVALIEAKLATSSNIDITRAERFLKLGEKGLPAPMGYHYAGAHTFRWSGSNSTNAQNLRRGSKLRLSIKAPVNHVCLVMDSAQIEARVIARLAGCDWRLDAFRRKVDLYKVAASGIYHIDTADVDKTQRQIGKVCIAEDSLVLTDTGLVPIQHVTAGHRVWDGTEWVTTKGAICNGLRDVITYQGLTATPDHEVWVEGVTREIPLALAAACGACLTQSGAGREALWVGNDYLPRTPLQRKLEQLLRAGAMQWLRDGEVDFSCVPDPRKKQRLSALLAATQRAEVVRSKAYRREAALSEPERRRVQELRCAGNSVQLPISIGSVSVVGTEPGHTAPCVGVGPDRRGRELRAGESALGNQAGELPQSAAVAAARMEPGRLAVRQDRCVALFGAGYGPRSDSGTGGASRSGEAQELAGHCRQARVYDLIDCGPKHRFTVSNCLVHNCELALGFGGAAGAFGSMAKNYGVILPDSEVNGIVRNWRRNNPEIVQLWADLGTVLMMMFMRRKGDFDVLQFEGDRNGGRVLMPNGLYLKYPNLTGVINAKRERLDDAYFTYKGIKKYIYGGSFSENLVQSLARIVIGEQYLAVERNKDFRRMKTHRLVMTTHDEGCFVVHRSIAKEMEQLVIEKFSAPPTWWPDLPVACDGGYALNYSK